MGTHRTSILTFTFLAAISVGACAKTNALPTRQECIVKVVSMAPSETKFDDGSLKGLVATAARMQVPLGGLAVHANGIAYLQFTGRCDKKFSMAEELLSSLFSKKQFRVEHQIVMPGPDTINLFGSSWRDGKMKWPPPVCRKSTAGRSSACPENGDAGN